MRSNKAKKAVAGRKKYMKDSDFERLMGNLDAALQHARGKRRDLRTTQLRIMGPPKPMSKTKIARLRKSLGCSQVMFANALNVSKRTVQSWEQGLRAPSDAALRLLEVIQDHPGVLIAPLEQPASLPEPSAGSSGVGLRG